MAAVINRESGEKTKGFRFQKLRAAIRLLKAIALSPKRRMHCAIELLEDSIIIPEDGIVLAQVEENKLYTSPLSFNSEPVRNTMVAFIDLDNRYLNDETLDLCFFASTTVAEERFGPQILLAAGVKPGTTTILKKLCGKVSLSPDDLKLCKASMVAEYKLQYKKREGGCLAKLESWSYDHLASFLGRIEWTVTEIGNDALEDEALQCIKDNPYFNFRHTGREDAILSQILNIFERNSEHIHPTGRLVNPADIENIFLKSGTDQFYTKPSDPAYKDWGSITTTDLRNLQEKITAVAPNFSDTALKRLNRRVALARDEAIMWDKEYVALRRRLYDVCEEVLEARKSAGMLPATQVEIDAVVAEMVVKSQLKISQLGLTYNCRIVDEDTLKGAVLSLFDECFLAFD